MSTRGFEDIATNLGYWFESKYKFNKAKVKLAVDDFCKSFFLEYPDFNLERIKEIEKKLKRLFKCLRFRKIKNEYSKI